jgi:hypothetical protein
MTGFGLINIDFRIYKYCKLWLCDYLHGEV